MTVPHGGGRSGTGRSRIGLLVFAILALLTAFEFVVAKELDANILPLALIAVIKAGLILWYFMHLRRAWHKQEAGE